MSTYSTFVRAFQPSEARSGRKSKAIRRRRREQQMKEQKSRTFNSRELTLDFLKSTILTAKFGQNMEYFSDAFRAETNKKAHEETCMDFPQVPVQIVSLPADKGRCTVIGSAMVITTEEFTKRQKLLAKLPHEDLMTTPLMASLKWENKEQYENGNLGLVELDLLLNSFLATGKKKIKDIREELAKYKQDRRGKALETPPVGINMFYAQLWGIFCGIFGAGRYDKTDEFRKYSPSGLQYAVFVESNDTLKLAVLKTTDRYSSSQLRNAPECADWVANLSAALGSTKDWVRENIVDKPTLIYNGDYDYCKFNSLIREKIKEKIKEKLPDVPVVNWDVIVELLKKQEWQKCAVDTVLSEKYNKHTMW